MQDLLWPWLYLYTPQHTVVHPQGYREGSWGIRRICSERRSLKHAGLAVPLDRQCAARDLQQVNGRRGDRGQNLVEIDRRTGGLAEGVQRLQLCSALPQLFGLSMHEARQAARQECGDQE